jgi:transposase InsO family protein
MASTDDRGSAHFYEAMTEHMRTEFVADALQMAVARRRPEEGLIHHSDAGSQGGFNRSSQRFAFGGIVDARRVLQRVCAS